MALKNVTRAFRRRPGVTALVVLTLALGIGANSAIFSVVDAILLRPLPFPEADRLVRIETVRGSERGPASMKEREDLKERAGDLFTGLAAYIPDSEYTLSGHGAAEKLPAILVTHDFFDVLGVSILHGGVWPEDFDRARNFGIVLSNRVWTRKLGGSPGLVGETLTLDASPAHTPSYTVYGVLPEGFDFPARTELYRSIYISRFFPNVEDRAARNVMLLARLAPGVTVEAARARLAEVGRSLARELPETNAGVGFAVTPLREVYVGSLRPYLVLLLGAVSLVLLIACANVANLLLQAALEREREIAIRAALGAGRGRIVRLLVAESVLLALAGGAAGLLLARWGLEALTAYVQLDLPAWMRFGLDGRALAVTFLLSLATGVLAGLTPALRTSAGRLPELLKAGGKSGGSSLRHGRLRALLVVAEVGLSLMLLVGAGLLARTFVSLGQTDPGFDPDRLLTFRVALPWTYEEEQTAAFQKNVLERLEVLPGVSAAAINANLPLAGGNQSGRGTVAAFGQPPSELAKNPYVNFQIVSPGYFGLMGIRLLRGRAFSPADREDAPPVAVVSERLARILWPGQDPIGKRLKRADSGRPDSPWSTVVGVVTDVKSQSLTVEPGPDIYVSSLQVIDGWMYFLLRTEVDPESLVDDVRGAVAAVDPNQPVHDVLPMRERLLETVWQQRVSGLLFGLFAALALGLAATGIYGVLSYSVEQRARETGIRMALGARPGQVLREILGETLRLTLLGVALGLAGAIALARALASLLYGVSPLDPPTFAAVCLLLVAVALAAGYLPARRATRVDPLEALRWG